MKRAILLTSLWLLMPSITLATIGETVATYLLTCNSMAWGLAHRVRGDFSLLYVSDYKDSRIYAYLINDGLEYIPSESIDTLSLHGDFMCPRGLAYGEYIKPYLYALTSNEADGRYDSRLWRIDLETLNTDWIGLNYSNFGITDREVFGLAYFDGSVYISYDTSNYSSKDWQVRHGILELKVADVWWERAKSGDPGTVEAHIPNSGRWTNTMNHYPRAPAFGLACMYLDSTQYLWGTSYHSYIYLADGKTGRGIFYFDSPGNGNIYGLAYGDGHLWAVDRISGTDQVHKIRVTGDYGTPVQGPRHVRHLSINLMDTLASQEQTSDLKHNFARIHSHSTRPNQDCDDDTTKIQHNGDATVTLKYYDPAGDDTARQYYYNVEYPAETIMPGESRSSSYEVDFWTSDYRQFVYPHRCNSFQPPSRSYTDDDDTVYRMSDYEAYEGFWSRMIADMEAEYGASDLSYNPFWVARNIVEFIKENYYYGNSQEPFSGHYKYNPANLKLRLIFDADTQNDKMSCSPSAFALIGLCRYQGIPARWIGTTKQRGDWDPNYDGLMTEGEEATDTSFHRWAEIWMGDKYGWQRFDPTPFSKEGGAPRQLSQFELMQNSACGVSDRDLILTAGSGYHEPFYCQKDNCQRYNSVSRYGNPNLWYERSEIYPDKAVLIEAAWSNACFINVRGPSGPVSGNTAVVEWDAVGRWDMDPAATVSVCLQPMKQNGSEFLAWGVPSILNSRVPYDAGSLDADISNYDSGWYRFVVVKDGDPVTGGQGKPFNISRASPYTLFSPQDMNQDGVVDIFDLVIVAQYFGQANPGNSRVDINRDGKVDGLDLALIAQYFNVY